MARPKKSDANKQPAPVAPAPAPIMAPMPIQQLQPQQIAPQAIPQPLQQMPPPGLPTAQRTVGVEEFIRVRDSVHARFNTITGLMKSFSDDFLRQTNLLIGEPAPFDNGVGSSMQALVASLDGIGQLGQFGDLVPHAEEKKERKKRTHDPNAPKRPLTPYFLYMQHARPIIANDLGASAPKGAVQEEGQRRWAHMSPQDKNAWNNAYQFNLRLYNARVHSYKAGNPSARDMSDADAILYADQNGIPQAELTNDDAIAPNDQDAIAEQLQMAVAPAAAPAPVAESVQEEAVKTPKNKGGRKRKSTAGDVEESEVSAAKIATPASPDKKRKRVSKVAEVTEEPKKSARKKKSS
ncbi:hypothetical protein F5X99DRAFT_394492 [Biscogniauxia marginata]|nr:hypothetical protein F5X99DRAFT_394492 [Biscogniauxia marginata]